MTKAHNEHHVTIPVYQPFPLGTLPPDLGAFVRNGAKAIGCDPSFVATPVLTALGAAIGTSRVIQLKRGHTEFPAIWAAIVGESGTAKSPALRLALQPLRERETRLNQDHATQCAEYATRKAQYDKERLKWMRGKEPGDPPAEPESPQAERIVVADTTVEALAPLLLANQRGLLLARDELAGWLGSFDRYAGGRGADAQAWLTLFEGDHLAVDRKKAEPPTIHVPQALVGVVGGIQPGTLQRCLTAEHLDSGLAARFLFAYPPRRPQRWTTADIDPAAVEHYGLIVDRLYSALQPIAHADGRYQPVALHLTPEAAELWATFYDEHAEWVMQLSGAIAAAMVKIARYAARLALVIHCARQATCDPTLRRDTIDAQSIEAGITIARWFGGEAGRIYGWIRASDEERELTRLEELIRSKGGSVTERELQLASRHYRVNGSAKAALDALAQANRGKWSPTATTQKGGRPTSRFVLFDTNTSANVYETPANTEKNGGFVDTHRDEDDINLLLSEASATDGDPDFAEISDDSSTQDISW